MTWLGFQPKCGDLAKICGSHLIGFTAGAVKVVKQYVDENPPQSYIGLDTWLKRLVVQGVLVKKGSRCMAVQKTHNFRGRK
jgi:hypothetical protein